MKVLKAKRALVKGTVTRIGTFAQSMDGTVTCGDCKTRLEKLEEAWSEYRTIQFRMLEKAENADEVLKDPDIDEFEKKYYEIKLVLENKVLPLSKPKSIILSPSRKILRWSR